MSSTLSNQPKLSPDTPLVAAAGEIPIGFEEAYYREYFLGKEMFVRFNTGDPKRPTDRVFGKLEDVRNGKLFISLTRARSLEDPRPAPKASIAIESITYATEDLGVRPH